VKKIYWILPAAAVGLFAAKRAGYLEAVNHCETTPHAKEASLRTRVYAASPTAVREQVLAALAEQRTYRRAWHVVAEREDGAFAIRVEVPVAVFTDDLTVTISPHEEGSRLDVHSQARIGRGDFGENRRHVLQLLNTLDAALPQVQNPVLHDRRATPRATSEAEAKERLEAPVEEGQENLL
jgi:uncharacterized protein (DUF1499 family)